MNVLILGQGLAGTLLSVGLRERGVKHSVVDHGHLRSSSRAAAGIVNPVTGRRFVKSWRFEALVPYFEVYHRLEALLGVCLRYPLTVLRDLSATKDLNQWDLRRGHSGYESFLGVPISGQERSQATGLAFPAQLGPTLGGMRVDLPTLLTHYRQLLAREGVLYNEQVSLADIRPSSGQPVTFQGQAYTHVVDCRGAGAMQEEFWRKLPWRGTKGEALRFVLPHFPRAFAVKRRAFVCPVGNTNEVWLGATNQDSSRDASPSPFGKTYLQEQWQTFAQGADLPPSQEHLAAIRPTTLTRRPFVGQHPEMPWLWTLNGLGGKGTSLGPWCVKQLVCAMLDQKPLDAEIDVAQYG